MTARPISAPAADLAGLRQELRDRLTAAATQVNPDLLRELRDVIERYATEQQADGWTCVEYLHNGEPGRLYKAHDAAKQAALLRLNIGRH